MARIAFFVLVAGALFAACVSTGKDFASSKAAMIEKGVTKKTDIQEWFGYPYMTGLDNGDKTWIYNYTKTSAGGKTQAKNLYIVFDDNGIVKSFTFSTSFPGEIAESR